ncbi:MAG TPA: ABC transporter permease subunit [Streptosporangiaceae bacterium]|jgi:ABC-2 type transport system permease protein
MTAGETAMAHGYAARRTLPLRVEAVRQIRRRRTWIAFGLAAVLPWVLIIAFQIGGASGGGDGSTSLFDLATAGGPNFAVMVLFASSSFLSVVAIALFCGDTVAGEASWSSLRYLLAAPVPRARLLRQKLIIALAYGAATVVGLLAMAWVAGGLVYGWTGMRLLTGGELPAGVALGRLAIAVAYALVSLLVVAALATLLSVWTDSPLGAVGGAVGLVIVSNILNQVTALGNWRQVLPTYWSYAWLDLFQPNVEWRGVIQGAAVSVSYAIVLLAFAFRHFRTKDVVS